MKIILFRHGQKQQPDLSRHSDRKDVFLTPKGIDQITLLGKALKTRFPTLVSSKIIYSSHYSRAIQSADIIKSILNIKTSQVVPEFGEFMAYTNYQSPKEFRQQIQERAMQHPDWISPETKTSLNNVLSNFQKKLIEIYKKSHPEFVLIASHGGIIRNFVYTLEPKFRPPKGHLETAKIHEAGYTIIDFDSQKFTLDQFDVHDFLD